MTEATLDPRVQEAPRRRARASIMVLRGTATPDDLLDLGVGGIRTVQHDLVADGRVDPAVADGFRDHWAPFVDAGFRLQLVAPFPDKAGPIGPTTVLFDETWRCIGRELGDRLGDLVDAWQLGNELNLWHFRAPLVTDADVVRYVRALAEGLRGSTNAGGRLGINVFGVDQKAARLLDAVYGSSLGEQLDFVGIDAYPGSWQPGGPADWRATIDHVSDAGGGRPIVVCELGFPSEGEVSRPGELASYLRRIGYDSIAAVRQDRAALVAAAPPRLAPVIAALPDDAWADDFEDTAAHLLKRWRHAWGAGPHSPAKQAAYFEACLPILLEDERITEVVLFLWRASDRCWTCGMPDCPLETRWGIVDAAGVPKPSFNAVRRLLRGDP
jgi:hypothetical protein